MKHMAKKVIPAETVDYIEKVTCDLCKKTIENTGGYNIDETELRHKTGEQYPEFGSGEEVTVDICPKCFDKELIPWLESKGAVIVKKEWDW